VHPQISLDGTPEKFYEVQFTMKLGKKNAQVPGCLNDLLDERLLFPKIRLQIKNVLGTTTSGPRCTFTPRSILRLLALHYQPIFPQAPLKKDLFHSLWLTWKVVVIRREAHCLRGFLTIYHVPSISE
jgi:hypothetical protein